MAETQIAPREAGALPEAIERALVEGDLSKLTTAERVDYYRRTCESLGLNPLTKPFGYLVLNGKLRLYPEKNCTDQLRQLRGVSIGTLREEEKDDLYTVWAPAMDKTGRTDEDCGVVVIKGKSAEDRANARMKATTKAKRRVTLSICGLGGMLDESELDTVRGARIIREDEPVIPTIRRPQAKETTDAGSDRAGSNRGGALRLGGGGDPHGDRGDRPDAAGRDDRAVGTDSGEVAAPPVREPGADDGDDDPPPAAVVRHEAAVIDEWGTVTGTVKTGQTTIPWPANRQQFKDASTKLISHEQFKTLMVALREKVGKDADTRIKDKLTGMGILHRNEIPSIMYAGLVDWVERGAPPNAEPKERIVRSRRR